MARTTFVAENEVMRITAILGICLLSGGFASAQATGVPPSKTEELIAEARRRMSDGFHTKDFQEKMSLAKFLQMLEKELAQEKKFALHFDRQAFGNDADKMLSAEVNLPAVPARVVLSTALRLALAQVYVPGQEIEFTARPGGLVITTRDRSLFTATYEIADLQKHTDFLHKLLPADGQPPGVFFLHNLDGPAPGFDLKADPAKPDEWLARQIVSSTDSVRAGWHKRTPASTIRVVNGTKLVVHTAPSVHEEIHQLLSSLRRLADLFVVMNARLYAVERAEYDKHFAPAFVDPKDKSSRRRAAPITVSQWKKLKAYTPILESDFDKLRPGERAVFLTQKNVYQFQARPGDATPTTAFEGFSFAVRPTVSPDRRCIRLELFHDVAQLVKLTKGTMVDLKTGKDMPIELPNVRKSSATATIDIHDGQAILLVVDYRLNDKVWLVVAEPRIYMEEEEEQIRKQAIRPMLLADEKPAPAEPPLAFEKELPIPPPIQLPDNDDVRQILQAIVESILTDPQIKDTRDFYGTPGDKKFSLDNEASILWPKTFRPKILGHTEEQFQLDLPRCFLRTRLLGIRVDGFDLQAMKVGAKEVSIHVTVHNVGGSANGGVIGGCNISYVAKRAGKGWKVNWTLISDP